MSRTGRDPWEGHYLIHDAVRASSNALPIFDVLAAGGADLNVRLKGETLLHLAAAEGDIAVATWLLDHGADVNAVNDCTNGCAERGYTPLHSGLEFRDDGITVLLLAGGARLEATGTEITDTELAKTKQWFAPGGPFATVSGIAQKSGKPMSEDDAREVLAKLDSTPR